MLKVKEINGVLRVVFDDGKDIYLVENVKPSSITINHVKNWRWQVTLSAEWNEDEGR